MALMHVNCYSKVLRQHISLDVLLPAEGEQDDYPPEYRWPTLYLLHGLSDDHTVWQRWSAIERKLGGIPLAVVMPTTLRGFYTDMKYGPRYFTFIAEELPGLCERFFHLSPLREDRFAAGLSMGGYGAFKLGLLHPEKYGAVASLSGALDVVGSTPFAYDYDSLLPEYRLIFGRREEAVGGADDLFQAAERLAASGAERPRFFMWCGTGDKLYRENAYFNQRFGQKLGIEYREGPGTHEWRYWDEHISDVLDWLPLRTRRFPEAQRTAPQGSQLCAL